MSLLLALAAVATQTPPTAAPLPRAPAEIIAAAPTGDWTRIAPEDLLVMDLAPDAQARARRVVIQLIDAPFSAGWVGNIRRLAAARFWDGLSVNRVQDNYVVQWGDGEAEDAAKARKLPDGLRQMPESEYVSLIQHICVSTPDGCGVYPQISDFPAISFDNYADGIGFAGGFPVAVDGGLARSRRERRKTKFVVAPGHYPGTAWPVHCYGAVGVGRSMPPDTGSGAELYAEIGHAPRHLDRNVAVVGRVIEGIEQLSSLPRGTGPLGFYTTAAERVPIARVRIGGEVADLPDYQYLSTSSASFAAYADARANRRDGFFIRPAGGADICNVPVPVRRVK